MADLFARRGASKKMPRFARLFGFAQGKASEGGCLHILIVEIDAAFLHP